MIDWIGASAGLMSSDVVMNLVSLATQARLCAYAPYSNFKVGAAVLAKSGNTYLGCNIERVGYTPTTHAEHLALDIAIQAGEREFLGIAVVCDTPQPTFPCGGCLQDLKEFDYGTPHEIVVISANLDDIVCVNTLHALIGSDFRPYKLGIDPRNH
jgi:cytidine deaminase